MDPFTIAAGIAGLGSIFKGITALISSRHEQQAANDAALQAEREGGVAADVALRQGDAVAAHAAVQAAANGGGFVGSSVGVIQQVASQAMFNARVATYKARSEAQADVYKGQVARAEGIQSFIGSMIDTGSSLVGGMARSSQEAQMSKFLATLRGTGSDSPYDYQVPY